MRQLNQKVRWGLAVAAGLGMFAAGSQAATYTYTEATSTTTQWSAGTSWDAAPVSDPSTILTFGAGTSLAAGTAIVSNNDLGSFVLNLMNFTYAGPASGTAPTLTVTGNALEFTGAGARINYQVTGTASASRPQLTIDNDLLLSSDLQVYGNATGPSPIVALNGVITGSGSLTVQDSGGNAVSYSLTNPGNDYTGDTRVVHSGSSGRVQVLSLGASSVIPSGVGRGNLVLSSPGEADGTVVQLNGHDQTVNGLVAAAPGSTNAGGQTVRNSASTAATLTVGDADTTASFVGSLTDGGSGALSLNKIGTGTQALSGAGSHTGSTTVSGGELVIDYTLYGTSKTATPADYFSSQSAMILAGGTTLTIEGRRSGAAITQAGVGLGQYSRTFTLPNAQADQLVVGQEVVFTKTGGSGTPATDVYITKMDRGVSTTTITANKRLGGTGGSTVTVDSLATVATTSQTLKSLTLSGSVGEVATLDFGGSDNVTLLINAAPVQLVDGSLLSIANWNGDMVNGGGGDQFRFVGLPTEFSSVFAQSEVTFQGYGTGYSIIDFGGQYEVVPIPEPASLGLIGLAALAGFSRRRRKR